MLDGCSDTCSNMAIVKLDAPDGRHSAVMFNRDCGATTGFSTQISILDVGETLDGSGNAFRADDDHGRAKVGKWEGPWAEMQWLSADRLLVRYAAKSRVFEQDDRVSGVQIRYQTVPD